MKSVKEIAKEASEAALEVPENMQEKCFELSFEELCEREATTEEAAKETKEKEILSAKIDEVLEFAKKTMTEVAKQKEEAEKKDKTKE